MAEPAFLVQLGPHPSRPSTAADDKFWTRLYSRKRPRSKDGEDLPPWFSTREIASPYETTRRASTTQGGKRRHAPYQKPARTEPLLPPVFHDDSR
jgi:hypothetical protein